MCIPHKVLTPLKQQRTMKAKFAINLHDDEGDIYQKTILIFLEDYPIILKLKDKSDLRDLIKSLESAEIEISENYPNQH